MRICVDVMGGDHGCGVLISGAKAALDSLPQLQKLLLVGQEAEVQAALRTHGVTDPRVEIVHASEVLTMEDKPLEAVRKKKDSSLVRAIELVREGRADAVISPGNTGALVAGSLKLRRLEGVERPALAARMPSRTGDFILIDAGANPECAPLHFAQFAVMGSLYASKVLGIRNPRVGVLSNGSEEGKGTELTREAAQARGLLDLNFIGYAEGFDLFNDAVDVVVTDGFTGNVVLKTSESLGYAMMHMLKKELTASPIRKFGALISQGAFRSLKKRLDPEVYGGAVLLGLRGNVIKAHGSARERAMANAIRVAAEAVQHRVNESIVEAVAAATARIEAQPTSAEPK
jgi:phosphate acyltransferase